MVIQSQIEFISFANRNEYAYKINISGTIFYIEKFYPRMFQFYWLRKSVH